MRRFRRIPPVALLTIAALTLAPLGRWSGRARAAEAREHSASQAKKHYEEGTKAFNLGEFPRAIAEFKAAYNAKPDPLLLYNIAQSFRLAGDPAQALFFYRSFLRNMPDAPNRKEVEGRIRTLERQVERQESERKRDANAVVPPPVTAPDSGGAVTGPPPARATDSGSPASGGPAIAPISPPAATTTPAPATSAGPPSRDSTSGDSTWGWHHSPPAAGAARSNGSSGREPPSAPSTSLSTPPAAPSPHLGPDVGPHVAPDVGSDVGPGLGASREASLPREPASEPLHKRWWFWPAVGATALVLLVGLAAAARRPPTTDLGVYDAVNWETAR